MKVSSFPLLFTVLMPLAAQEASSSRPVVMGYRGDGSNVVLTAKLPTSADETTGANIRWKAALPNWGLSQPLVVGQKVFVTSEPGWPEDEDFVRLTCYDLGSGKELWHVSLDHLTVTTKDKSEHDEILKKWHAVLVKRSGYYTTRSLNRDKPDFDPKSLDSFKKEVFEDVKPLLKYGLILDGWNAPAYGAGLYCVGNAFPTPCSDGERVYVATGMHSFFAVDFSGKILWTKSDPINQHWNTYGGNDFCKNARSPLISGNLFLSDVGGKLRAFDRTTGEMRWSQEIGKDHQCMVTPVIITSAGKDVLLCGGPGAKMSAFLLPEGSPVPTDWKVTGGMMLVKYDERDVVFMSGHGDHVTWGGENASKPEHLGPACVRFTLKDGKLEAQYLWGGINGNHAKGNENFGMVYAEGKFYHFNGVILDAKTGAVVAGSDQKNGPRAVPNTKSLLAVAGGHVYGVVDDGPGSFANNANPKGTGGHVEIYTIQGAKVGVIPLLKAPAEGEKKRQITSQNQYATWGFSYNPTPTIAGDSLLIRSNDFLWCIGAK